MNNILILVLVIAILCILMYRNNQKRETEKQIQKLKESFGQTPDKKMSARRYEMVPAYYRRHHADTAIDDITWNDLELDHLYHWIDSTQSAAGEEYLYYVLRTPAQSDAEAAEMINQSVVAWMGEETHAEQRVRLQRILQGLGHTGPYSLYDYLDQLDTLGTRSNVQDILCCILPFAAIGVMFVNVQMGIVCLLAVLCYNLVTYYRERGEIAPFLVSFRYLLRLMEATDRILDENCEALGNDNASLQTAVSAMSGFRRGSGIVMNSAEAGTANPLDLLLDYLRILFHLDLIKFNSMLEALRTHREQIDTMLLVAGRIDAEIAIASFRASLQYSCDPTFIEIGEERRLRMTDLVHPMLENAVPNTVDLTQSMLLTGSNASGKSTFLKAAALAALLAQTIGVVPADGYQAPRFRIYSSMALRDSMQDGDSYFMVEIKSLKRIVDAANAAGNPVLCCIDEVLRGTNTVERIAASSEILQHIDETGHVLCIAATHDLELAGLLTGYTNDHFAETLEGEDVVFSYRLMNGKAQSRNAIRLLSQIGFDTDITARAQARAEHYDSTGEWI